VKHPKLTELVIGDFLALEEYTSSFGILRRQGVHTGAVGRQMFRRVKIDYPEAVAKIIKDMSPNARLYLLSGAGADRNKKSPDGFAKDKGKIENRLSKLGLGLFHHFRSGYIFPVTPRQELGFGYRLAH